MTNANDDDDEHEKTWRAPSVTWIKVKVKVMLG